MSHPSRSILPLAAALLVLSCNDWHIASLSEPRLQRSGCANCNSLLAEAAPLAVVRGPVRNSEPRLQRSGCANFCNSLLAGAAPLLHSAPILNSRDAYVRRQGNTWLFGTAAVEKQISLDAGRLPETRFSVNGKEPSGPWQLANHHATLLAQGEIQFDLELHSQTVGIIKHFVLYPETSVIREWLTITNRSNTPWTLGDLCFLHSRVPASKSGGLQLSYLTGGGNYNGSQLLKSEPVGPAFTRVFDSYGGIQKESYSGYLPLIFLRNGKTSTGVAIGWDYLGHWRLQLDAQSFDYANVELQVAGYEKQLAPGEQVETPKSFTASFAGDVDDLGNQLLDWQYRYLWQYTNPDYFAKTRWAVDWPEPWVGDGGKPSADNWGRRLALDLRYIDLMRETGTDILWDDAGWYDKWGSWNGPDWRRTNEYLAKYGMRWVLWEPIFLATPVSKIGREHPEWLIPGRDAFEQSIQATADWQGDLLDRNVKDWGNFQWRYDIAPAVSATDTGYLDSDRNFRDVLARFKRDHPQSGIDACYGGGRLISPGIAQFAESGEYTDGGVGPYSAYYTSLLVPPDKYHNVSDFDHTYYNAASDHVHLSMDPTWYRDPGDGPDLEQIRKDWELYRYLTAQNVVGRWSHVFRPRVEGDDPIWYFQRMNRDGSKGVILTKHAKQGEAYFLISKLTTPSKDLKDEYRGAGWDMNQLATTSDARIDTGLYRDPVDGEYRYYGSAGEAFGPLNFHYKSGSDKRTFITGLPKLGAKHQVENNFFGMSIQLLKPLTITGLGQFDPGNNKGAYTLSLVKAVDKTVVATTLLDMSRAHPDSNGFKFSPLPQPVQLAAATTPITIYPKGLLPDQVYDVRASHAPLHLTEKGALLMTKGLTLDEIVPGELIFLNLPHHPGSGEDKTAPDPPTNVTKRRAANLGAQGIELAWAAGHDDNWISYYEVFKNGKLAGKAAKGTFFFDHTQQSRGDLNARFEVRTVDGDGNRSPFAPAQLLEGDPETYEALGDFSPTQGANHWVYEQALDDGSYAQLAWDSSGYEGRWTGSGQGRIGRIWMQPSAQYDLSRTFIAPTAATIETSATLRKDPSAENGSSVFVRIVQNDTQIWPPSGWTEVTPHYDVPVSYRLTNIQASPGDRIRFIVKHNGQNRPDPLLWDPVLILATKATH